MIPRNTPFVLLDDARDDGGPARLYTRPSAVVVAGTAAEVPGVLEAIRQATAAGRHVAGFLGYDAGAALEPRLIPRAGAPIADAPPLAWFGVFDTVDTIARGDVLALLPDPAGCWTGEPRPRLSRIAYGKAFARVADFIAAGDIYQANLSFRADVPFAGHPLAVYARLRSRSAAGWGGIAFTGRHWIMSASPELFFTLDGRTLTARPMKGTARRGATPAEDRAAAAALADDAKERAENLMIVDLLRNDLSRIADPGSVEVPALFAVETYPTLHTLTSTITARLSAGRDAVDVLAATFPCGSITGAPKIRAMEIIAEVEADPRGPYTGALGWIAPDGDAAFNVLIRTLVVDERAARRGHGVAELGLGSAVVADSVAEGEWQECLTKARFAVTPPDDVPLIETMRLDGGAIVARDRHLARLAASARCLGYRLDPALAARLDARIAAHDGPARVRLRLWRDGRTAIDTDPLPPMPSGPVAVAFAPLPVDPADVRLRHKTGDRAPYDDARAASGGFEVVFVDPDGFVTEGSFTNVFVDRGGMLLTPPLSRGLLPGILRATLLADGRAREADLTPADLAHGFYIGNALRGLIPAKIAGDGSDPV